MDIVDKRIDVSTVPGHYLREIAEYIKADTLDAVNQKVIVPVCRETLYTKYGKRLIDIVLSSAALVLTAPINSIIAVVTTFDVGFPIIFKQVRIGKKREPFVIYKFRNMTNETDANGELLPPAQRVTKWGKFVRKTSLDELLNFVSILKGDMSLIGPRPLIPNYIGRLNDRHLAMYSVKPGLECPFPENLDHAPDWQDRLENYIWYAQNVSLLVDIKLIWRMLYLVFSKESTQKRSVSKNGAILGYDMNGKVIDSNAVPEKYVEMVLKNHNFKTLDELIEDRFVKSI